MCGITGIYGLSDRKLIKRMTDTLKHRGPDGEGYYVDETVSLGHRRLSIIDLKTGSQPIYNEDGSIIVVYNGEIYNYKSLRSDLEKKRGKGKKHSFCSTSDTDVLVLLYEEHFEDFIETLNGIFAFALYDSNKRKLLIARDRIGIKPLYYVRLGSKLLFSSEIKSILQYDGVKREIDKEGLSSYLTYGSVLGEQTMFKSIKKLQPGHLLTYDGKNLVIKKYYKRKEEISYYNEDLAAKRLRSLLEKSVDSQLMSDVPLGAFLSGGVDSSTIVGIMSGIMKRPVETFTVGFGREDDELKYARITSEHFSTKHHEIMVYPKDVPPIISKLVWHYDDLIWDAASVPTYFVSELAKKHVKVVLTGEGGDELFGGYNRYKPFSPYFWFVPSFFKKKAYDMFSQLFDPWIRLQVLGNYPSRYSEEIENEYFRKTKGMKSILYFEKEQLLPNQLLNKVDKASMAASIEARVPFLDNTIV
ncbi:MAG: asparagine synthase (glutamine-hydrolyzing), partial [Candidatus Bathyarchaeota archaeon]|nr:asparagine synthase (glutamine-hydrolyzing) [Candidatus Bathyarchaeota archaeon]